MFNKPVVSFMNSVVQFIERGRILALLSDVDPDKKTKLTTVAIENCSFLICGTQRTFQSTMRHHLQPQYP